MTCRCAERRAKVRETVAALKSRSYGEARAHAASIARTFGEDASDTARRAVVATRNRMVAAAPFNRDRG